MRETHSPVGVNIFIPHVIYLKSVASSKGISFSKLAASIIIKWINSKKELPIPRRRKPNERPTITMHTSVVSLPDSVIHALEANGHKASSIANEILQQALDKLNPNAPDPKAYAVEIAGKPNPLTHSTGDTSPETDIVAIELPITLVRHIESLARDMGKSRNKFLADVITALYKHV